MVAVTESGRAIQSSEASAGDLEFKTPFGVFVCPTDPVERVEDRTLVRNRYLSLMDAGEISAEVLVYEASASGFLSLMAEQAHLLLEEDLDRPGILTLLESWGTDLDSIPKKTKREERIDWLWSRMKEADPVSFSFLSGRLQFELSGSRHADPDRLLERRQLREAARDKSLLMRRAAFAALGAQKNFEEVIFSQAMEASVGDIADAVRLEAARACGEIDRRVSRQIWTYVLARNRGSSRQLAGEYLGRFGGPQAVDPLIHVLAAAEYESPDRFEFCGRKIQVMKDIASFSFRNRTPAEPQILNFAASEVWRLGTSFLVRTLEEDDAAAVLIALEYWAREATGRSAADWLKWYEEEKAQKSAL